MFEVTYKYFQDSPRGGQGCWKTEKRLYDAENAKELQRQIDEFCNDDKCGYRKWIKVLEIKRI